MLPSVRSVPKSLMSISFSLHYTDITISVLKFPSYLWL